MEEGGPEQKRRVGRGGNSRDGEVEGDGKTSAGCREPDMGLSSARKAENSSHSDSPDVVGARVTNSSENMPITVIEVTSPTMWQGDVTASGGPVC